tara:strand:- start:633 stop:1799 length:1167 start_codon:yes stop_codon:yes gene_type:complete
MSISDFTKEIKPLRLAVIGGGLNSAAGYSHFVSTQLDGFFQITCGFFSTNKNINHETCRRYGIEIESEIDSWERLIERKRDNFDAILILTPTPNHFEIAKTTIEKNIPTICEKPLTTDYNEAKYIHSLIKKNNCFLAITYNYSGYPMLRELSRQIACNKLGKISQIMIEMPQETFIKTNRNDEFKLPQQWRQKDKKISSLSLDLGSHIFHLIDVLISDIKLKKIISTQNNFGKVPGITDNINLIAETEDNIIINGWFSKVALGHRNGLKIRVYGSNGSAEWEQTNPEILTLVDKKGAINLVDRSSNELIEANRKCYQRFKAGHPAGFIEAYANLYRDIYLKLKMNDKSNINIRTDKFPFLSGINNSLDCMKFLEAIELSSQLNCWIEI